MAGFMYRTAIAVKDFGERHNLPWVIRMGLALKVKAGTCNGR
jgi:hypothetical protein